MAGMTVADGMTRHGCDVVVAEKARGPGGRMATRRGEGGRFDHGAQYFTARSPEFRAQVEKWRKAGLAERWEPTIAVIGERPGNLQSATPAERWVGVPGMNAIVSEMAGPLDCRYRNQVEAIEPTGSGWRAWLYGGNEIRSKSVVLTAPPAQCAGLLGEGHRWWPRLRGVAMKPCIALMARFAEPLHVGFDAAFINTGPLGWVARNGSKPGREGETWVIHAGQAWSQRMLDADPGQLVAPLLDAFSDAVGSKLPEPEHAVAHRWRYALADPGLEIGCLADPRSRLFIAGDWCAGNRVEGAWSSGRAVCEAMQGKF